MANTGGRKFKHKNFTTYQSYLSSSSPSSSSIPDYKYDVFLSFNVGDTGNSFTDHLRAELIRNKINAYKDDEELDRGKEISPELLQAINDSRFCIVVLSVNYAASRWCLDELVYIFECLKPGKSIFPIFYHVDPSVDINNTESYKKAFSEIQLKYKNQVDKVKRWRVALDAVAGVAGWHLNQEREVEFIQKIVQVVSSSLDDTSKVLDRLDNVYEGPLRKLKSTSEGFSNGKINHHKLQSTPIDSHQQKLYDVFISFKGDNNVTSFTDHLYTALDDKGITYFKDDEKHDEDIGKDNVSPKRMQAIKDSRLSFIVLSTNYAASTLCLDELVHILECRKYGNKVFPIFYDVVLTVVRYLTDSYGEAFTKHEESYEYKIVQRWRSALVELANIMGFLMKNRHEQELTADIVVDISGQLKIMDKWGTMDDFSGEISYENLVGIDSRVKELMLCLDTDSNYNSIIGIHGMSGIGKTTIARVIYNKISDQFDVCCFLANVREDYQRLGLFALQHKLVERLLGKVKALTNNEVNEVLRLRLRTKKVLIVLDDVDHSDQLEALVCNADWFGVGSRILITTRDAHLLMSIRADAIYRCEMLNNYESMQLLCLTAFEQNYLMEGYEMVCKSVVDYAYGLPLVLRIIGGSLSGRSINEWEHFLESTKHDLDITIFRTLRIGYDSLDEKSKDIFLHIACFFNMKKSDRVLQVLESCYGVHSRIGMAILIQNSLVTISDNILIMHDLLQAMGRKIVRDECVSEPDKCSSRLWHHDDIYDAMTRNSGTEAIRAIVLDHPKLELDWEKRAFSRFYNLRMLSIHSKVQLPEGLEYLPDELRFFKWWSYPLKSFPSNFYPSQLVELNMCHGNIELLWKGDKVFYYLKTIKLSYSQNLVNSPDFTVVPNLERLDLGGCGNLVEIDPSIGSLRKLRFLNLEDCSSLRSLPDFISMESLEICTLSGCSSLGNFPKVAGSMSCLSQLYFDGRRTAHRRELDNINLASLLSNIPNITKLSLRDCDLSEGAIPSVIGYLTSLEVLDLSRNKFISLPTSISQLVKLKLLGLAHCNLLQSVPELPSNIEYVEARDCSSLMTFSNPSEVTTSSRGLVLSFINCYELKMNQDGKSLIIAWLKAYLRSLLSSQKDQELQHLSGRFNIIVPGNRNLEWLSHQSKGPSVRIHLPLKWSNNNWIGFVFCVVFGVREQRVDVKEDEDHLESENSHEITCQLYTNEGLISSGFGFRISKGTRFDSSHLWLQYISNGSFRERMVIWNRVSCIEASFGMESRCLEVKECGLRVVYKQDVEETKIRKLQYIIPPIEDLGVDFFHFDA